MTDVPNLFDRSTLASHVYRISANVSYELVVMAQACAVIIADDRVPTDSDLLEWEALVDESVQRLMTLKRYMAIYDVRYANTRFREKLEAQARICPRCHADHRASVACEDHRKAQAAQGIM